MQRTFRPPLCKLRRMSLVFAIYPGGVVGTVNGLSESKPDDPARVNHALNQLQPKGKPFLVRAYSHFAGVSTPSGEDPHPQQPELYAINGRRLNLVLCFRDPAGDIAAWTEFVVRKIRQHAAIISTLSVTLEPNLSLPNAALDGSFPSVIEALVEGVAASRGEIDRQHLPIQVGFCASQSWGPGAGFWAKLAKVGGKRFAHRSIMWVSISIRTSSIR